MSFLLNSSFAIATAPAVNHPGKSSSMAPFTASQPAALEAALASIAGVIFPIGTTAPNIPLSELGFGIKAPITLPGADSLKRCQPDFILFKSLLHLLE